MHMKTLTIDHPLRTISYKVKDNSFPTPYELQVLDDYRLAHDQVWYMKRLFESEKAEAQLALIDLHKLDEEQEELSRMLTFYKGELDINDKKLHANVDILFQVELRNFYNSVIEQQQKLIRFYDHIGIRDREYTLITDTYYKEEKPVDPLHFTVLDFVFEHYEDMQVDIVSLDKDLQEFLAELSDVYRLLDAYIAQFNLLYRTYETVLKKTAQLTRSVQVFQVIWENQ